MTCRMRPDACSSISSRLTALPSWLVASWLGSCWSSFGVCGDCGDCGVCGVLHSCSSGISRSSHGVLLVYSWVSGTRTERSAWPALVGRDGAIRSTLAKITGRHAQKPRQLAYADGADRLAVFCLAYRADADVGLLGKLGLCQPVIGAPV